MQQRDFRTTKPLFQLPQWHKPYAETLLESDPARLPPLIEAAEQAIQAGHSELCANPPSAEESLDLQNAAATLSQLRQFLANRELP